MRNKITLEQIQAIASKHNGECISGQLPRVRDPRLVPDTLAMLSTHSAD